VSKIRVMVVDDHPIVRKGLEVLLAGQDDMAVVGEAASGREALEKSRLLQPDVVLLDIALPDCSGLEVIGRLRRAQPASSVVIFSAHDKEFYVGEALRAGALGYVLKSAVPGSVEEAVRAAYRGEYFLCRKIRNGVIKAFLQGGEEGTPKNLYAQLSGREKEVFRLLVGGRSVGQIAEALYLSPKTVEKHRANIRRKLGCRNLVEMVKFAISLGISDLDGPSD